MPSGYRTPPEVEERTVAMIREGRTRPQVAEATGLSIRTLMDIAKRNEVTWARTDSGSSGTPEAMDRARGYRSAYMQDRRSKIAEKLLDLTERNLELAERETDPRKRQALSQAVDASMRRCVDAGVHERDQDRAGAGGTGADAGRALDARAGAGRSLVCGQRHLEYLSPRPGLIQE